MKCSRKVAALLLVLLAAASRSFAADKKQLSDALAAVDANLKTPAGKQYDERIGNEFAERYLPSIRQCKQSLPAGGSVEPFDMFLKLNAEGKVLDGLIYPETQFAVCTRTALHKAKFSAPPHGDYWINIHMQFKR